MKRHQVMDGEWIRPDPQHRHELECCDCGLVHIVAFKVVRGRVVFRAVRDERKTATTRREKRKAVRA